MRQRAVPVRIFGQIDVEQVDRDHRTRRAAGFVLPGAAVAVENLTGTETRPQEVLPAPVG